MRLPAQCSDARRCHSQRSPGRAAPPAGAAARQALACPNWHRTWRRRSDPDRYSGHLARPGRDPRSDAPAPVLRSDVLKMEDLSPGMRLKGTVRNVIDFGAFVDIGVKQDGLLHRSQIPAGRLSRSAM